jgi:hypothetical protein
MNLIEIRKIIVVNGIDKFLRKLVIGIINNLVIIRSLVGNLNNLIVSLLVARR